MISHIRVSAVWEDGTSVDNDKIDVSGMSDAEMEDVINSELASAEEWFSDRNPKEYAVSIYSGDRSVDAYIVER